jgi:glycosyltransferase involved in cell wall biosynthesis
MYLPTSIFIITFNEADRIGRTIEAIRDLSDDIVVVDSGSTDGTQEIATSLGARVIQHGWQGYGLQKRFAEDQCRHEWLFNLDADEVVDEYLKSSIRGLFKDHVPMPAVYRVKSLHLIPGETKPSSFAYADCPVRLYHRTIGRFSTSSVHDRVQVSKNIVAKQLEGVIFHFSLRSLGSQLNKFNNYTDDLVNDLLRRNVVIPRWRIILEFPLAFTKAFFGRRYFGYGMYGYLMAINYAMFRHLRMAKYYESYRAKKVLHK